MKAAVIVFPGSNCDRDCKVAIERSTGAQVDMVWHGETALPDTVIAPVVGYDEGCFRLGYGGGFFDRTLAAMQDMPLAIGVGYSLQSIATIHAQPHDIAMSMIVTETATHLPR